MLSDIQEIEKQKAQVPNKSTEELKKLKDQLFARLSAGVLNDKDHFEARGLLNVIEAELHKRQIAENFAKGKTIVEQLGAIDGVDIKQAPTDFLQAVKDDLTAIIRTEPNNQKAREMHVKIEMELHERQ